MPRRRRHWLSGGCYHITHRCLDRNFFFKYAKERDLYLYELFEAKNRYHLDVLNYMVTSNHIHLLLYCRNGRDVEQGIQYVHGRIGQRYNQMYNRQGSFWSDRYHTVLIESGDHLSRCLFYIDYNMLRNGVVNHPEEWKHSGYQELSGRKKRYRIISQERLLRCLGVRDKESFRNWYLKTIDAKADSYLQRQPYWTEASIVGSMEWIESVAEKAGIRRRTKIEAINPQHLYDLPPENTPLELREPASGYFALT